jgi:hypothetical protein
MVKWQLVSAVSGEKSCYYQQGNQANEGGPLKNKNGELEKQYSLNSLSGRLKNIPLILKSKLCIEK